MANDLLGEAEKYNVGMIVFENLEGIMEDISSGKEFQQWIFSKFYEIVEYKAKGGK